MAKLSRVHIECFQGHASPSSMHVSPRRRVWSCSSKWRVAWQRNYNGRLRGNVVMRAFDGDVWVSASPWEYDADESRRLRRLRAMLSARAPNRR